MICEYKYNNRARTDWKYIFVYFDDIFTYGKLEYNKKSEIV